MALEGYCSPNLRKAVFDLLHPGNVVTYEVVPIAEAFPVDHREYDGRAVDAIRCTITMPDGSYVEGCKEIDVVDEKTKRSVPQTPENLVKDQTKALGRALRDGGIPQKRDELAALMSLIVDLHGRVPISQHGNRVDRATGEINGSDDPDAVDSPDAGAEPSAEQLLAKRFGELNGADKRDVTLQVKEKWGVSNIMRAGEHAEEIMQFIDTMHRRDGVDGTDDEEPF